MNDEELQAKVDELICHPDNVATLAAAVCDLDDEVDHLKRIITKLGKRLKMYKEANQRLAAHNLTIKTLMADRGISCDRIIRGDRAMAKLEKIRELIDLTEDWEVVGHKPLLEILNDDT